MSDVNPRSAEGYRASYTDLSTSGPVLAAGAGVNDVILVPGAKWTIFVQTIFMSITTSAAQTITVRDDAGTPVPLFIVPASAAAGTIYKLDFGAKGYALTEGKNLDIFGTAGPAYIYTIEAYARQTGVTQSTTTDRIF